MDEELKNLQLDKPQNWNKSSEIIAKHSVESQFESKPIERSLHLLRKGDDLQKLSVIQALPQLLQFDSNATLTRIVPKIQQELPKSSCEFHIATSKIFKLLIEKQLPLNLITAVLQGIDSKDPDVSMAWVETLVSVIPILPIDQIKSHVIPSALARAPPSNPIHTRVNCCRILGKCASHPKMSNIDVKTVILPAVQVLCQDISPEVRATMCSQLHFVAQGLGVNMVQSGLLPNLVELAADENMIVRSSAISAAVLMIPFLNRDTKTDTIIPLIKQLCQKTKDIGDTTFPMIAKQFGKLVDALGDDLSPQDSVWFLQYFKTLATKGAHLPILKDNTEAAQAVMCREQCAYNIPAVTVFTVKKAPNQLELWHDIFSKLANDPCYLVRRTTAGSVHEVAKILGPNCKIMKDDLIKLLRDDSEDILLMLVPNIGVTLELFCINGVLSREQTNQSTLEMSRAILKCHVELSKGHNWRIKTDLLAQLERLPNCVPSDFIHQHFTPVMINCLMQARPKPLRSQAGRTLLIFLRYNQKEMQRKWIRDNLIQNLCYNKSCYTRQIYVNICSHAMEIFSGSYFKKHFFESLITLSNDPISNVRWSVINILPQLCRMLIMPEDKKLQVVVDNIFLRMDLEEKDKDVKSVFRERLKEIRSPFDNKQDRVMEDKRKFEEETRILQGKAVGIGGQSKNMPQTANRSMLSQKSGVSGVSSTTSHLSREQVPSRMASQRSTSAPPPRNPSTLSSDMSFLEQHFYIDAGINLPSNNLHVDLDDENDDDDDANEDNNLIASNPLLCHLDRDYQSSFVLDEYTSDVKKDENVAMDDDLADELATLCVENINIEAMSENELKTLEKTTTNITDDVKVNLRKRSNRTNQLKSFHTIVNCESSSLLVKPKRYSYSASSASERSKISKRKSLNLVGVNASGDLMSRIPICMKKSTSIDIKLNDNKTANNNMGAKLKATTSKPRPKSEILPPLQQRISDVVAFDLDSIKKINSPNKKSITNNANSKPSALPVLKRPK